MQNLIQEGRPVIHAVTHTDEPGIEARVFCLVDGFAAQITHSINVKRQEYNNHDIRVFDPVRMMWTMVLTWGFADVGHVPIHPDAETVIHLSQVSERLWGLANVVLTQSRLRREEVSVAQHVAEQMAHQAAMMEMYRAEPTGEPGDEAFSPRPIDPEQINDLRRKLEGEDGA